MIRKKGHVYGNGSTNQLKAIREVSVKINYIEIIRYIYIYTVDIYINM